MFKSGERYVPNNHQISNSFMFVKSKAWNVKFIVIFLKNKPHELINKFKKSKRMNQQNVAKEKLCTFATIWVL